MRWQLKARPRTLSPGLDRDRRMEENSAHDLQVGPQVGTVTAHRKSLAQGPTHGIESMDDPPLSAADQGVATEVLIRSPRVGDRHLVRNRPDRVQGVEEADPDQEIIEGGLGPPQDRGHRQESDQAIRIAADGAGRIVGTDPAIGEND